MSKTLNPKLLKVDFPIFQQKIHGKPLIYLDNAASTQKPKSVIQAMVDYYQQDNANVHRGIYTLSERSTILYERARETVRQFIQAQQLCEIVFTRGTTDAINLIANSFSKNNLLAGDEIIISEMEHHSNLVPWQVICEQVGARLKVIRLLGDGNLDLEHYQALLNSRTKLVAVAHVSNVLGIVNPIQEIVRLAHQQNVPVLVDGAQAIPKFSVNVQELDCDFYVFSAHKMYGPMGVGVLYGKKDWLEKLPPYQCGGGMILQVQFEKIEYNVLPYKFEAGTPNVAAVVGLAAAIDYLNGISMDAIHDYEKYLTDYTLQALRQIPGLKIIGDASNKLGVISLVMEHLHPHDMATILDHEGIAIRAGHHCAMPLMQRFQLPATARVSFGIYNDTQEIDQLVEGLIKASGVFT